MLRWLAAVCLAGLLCAMPAHAEGPAYPGQVSHGADYASPNVSRGDWKACEKICNDNGACKMWALYSDPATTDHSVCYLKSNIGKLEPWATIDSGLRTAPERVEGGAPLQGYGYVGNDFMSFAAGRDDWKACSKACDLNGACKAWSLYSPDDNKDVSYCWMKSRVGEVTATHNTVSGPKTAQTPIPSPGKIEKGKAFIGQVLYDSSVEYGDTATCKMRCETNRYCVAWSLFNPDSKKGGLQAKCHMHGQISEQVNFKTAYSAWRELPVLDEAAPPIGDEMLRWRSLEEVVAEFAPQITPRTLTAAEKGEIAGLELAILQGGSFDYFRKLDALARTGDKAAMKAIINVLLDIGQTYGRDWPADFPYKVRPTQSFGQRAIGAHPLQRTTAVALAVRWAVPFWQMHGGDQRAALALSECANADKGRLYNFDCGFTMSFQGDSRPGALNDYFWGRTKSPPQISFALHEPATTVEMEQFRYALERARYEELVNTRRAGQKLLDLDAAWLNRYAEVMGLTDAMNASIAQGEAIRMQIAAEDAERRRKDLQVRWDQLYSKHSAGGLTTDDVGSMEYIAAAFGDEKLLWFSDTYGLTDDYALSRLCAVDTATARCRNQTNAINQKRADAAALAADVAAYNAGVDAVRRAGLQSSLNMVDVRTYDANGNYTGTRTMSETQAEIVGARPQ
jgi:PAN domain